MRQFFCGTNASDLVSYSRAAHFGFRLRKIARNPIRFGFSGNFRSGWVSVREIRRFFVSVRASVQKKFFRKTKNVARMRSPGFSLILEPLGSLDLQFKRMAARIVVDQQGHFWGLNSRHNFFSCLAQKHLIILLVMF